MNAKMYSFLNAVMKFAKEDIEKNSESILTFLKSVQKIDFDYFVDCWEYLLLKNAKLMENSNMDKILTTNVLELSFSKNQSKTIKTIATVPQIAECLYEKSAFALEEKNIDILITLIASQKLDFADEILRFIKKNSACKKSFGQCMVIIVEQLFIELLKRQGNATKKIEMPKKVANFLNLHISKIRGAERALLEQRIREIM